MSEYACQVFHNSPPISTYFSEELEKIQRRALKIIFPDLGYLLPTAPIADGAPIQWDQRQQPPQITWPFAAMKS